MTREPLSIRFHGTSAENARKIRQDGFREWTYFAHHLEDAVAFGGGHVFEVVFTKAELKGNGGWQFRARTHVAPDRIVAHRVYESTMLHENEKLRKIVFKSNMAVRRPVTRLSKWRAKLNRWVLGRI